MKKILAFSGSNSSKSVNQQLVRYAASMIKEVEVTVIDLRDFPMPLYSADLESEQGKPEEAVKLKELMDAHDGFIISVPEHNSSVPAFFKNSIDWVSRVQMGFFEQKPIALLGTSPGGGGAKRSIQHAESIMGGYLAGKIIGTFSFPKFYGNTETGKDGNLVITDEEQVTELNALIQKLEQALLTVEA